jgi:hypothetical protein
MGEKEFHSTVKGIDNIIFYSLMEVHLAEALWAYCQKNGIDINGFFNVFACTLRIVKDFDSNWIG